VATLSLIGMSIPLLFVPMMTGLLASAALFAVAGLLGGPFVGSLLAVRQLHAPEAHRTQIFMVAAGARSAFAAAGAGLAGAIAGIGVGRLLVLAAATELICGVVAMVFVRTTRGTTPQEPTVPG
jgi:hypothetical protein